MPELLRRATELDPTVLADAARALPVWAGWLLSALGIAVAFFGAHHTVLRGTVALLAGLVGWAAADAVVRPETLGITADVLSLGAGAALALLGGAWPVAAGFVIWGLAGAMGTARFFPFEEPFLRALPGAVIGGSLGGLFVRHAAGLASSLAGAAVAAVGIANVLLHQGQADWIDPHPVVTLLPFSLLFVSGAAVQLTRRPPERREPAPSPPREEHAHLSGGGAA